MNKSAKKLEAYGLCAMTTLAAACGGTLELGGSGAGTGGTGVGTGGSGGHGGRAGAGNGSSSDGGADGGFPAQGGTGLHPGGGAGSAGKAEAGSGGARAGASNAGGGSGGTSTTAGDAGEGGSTAGAGGDAAAPECDCAGSEALTLIDCGTTRAYGGPQATYVSADGMVILFTPGFAGSEARLGRWTRATGTAITPGYPLALSDDGSIGLVGGAISGYYRLNADLTRTALPLETRLLSADGTTAVGVAETSPGVYEVVRWTEAGGIAGTGVIGNVAPGARGAEPQAISDDASVIGGVYYDQEGGDASRPFLWNGGAPILIGDAPTDGSTPSGGTFAVSPDGTRLAGGILTHGGAYSLFTYSEADGVTELGPCYSPFLDCPTANESYPVFSADGSVLAGTLGAPDHSNPTAFRHTAPGGVVSLDPNRSTEARGMSRDASLVLGIVSEGNGSGTPLVWDDAHGERELEAALGEAGADLRGWHLTDAFVLSKDGNVAVGQGTCGGKPALYRAVIPR